LCYWSDLLDVPFTNSFDQIFLFVAIYICKESRTYFDLPESLEWLKIKYGNLYEKIGLLPNDIINHGSLVDYISISASLPIWITKLIIQSWNEQSVDIAHSFNHPGPISIRVNVSKISMEDAIQYLSSLGIICKRGLYSPTCLHFLMKPTIRGSLLYEQGLYDVQDEGSQLITLAAGIKPQDNVLDYCAGRGGKAVHICDILGNEGTLTCHDIDPTVLSHCQKRLEKTIGNRLCIDYYLTSKNEILGGRGGDVTIRQVTNTLFNKDMNQMGLYDIVLVDAPCLALGVLRRGPNVRWEMKESDLEPFPDLQLQILKNASNHVKIGGTLLYSTCTWNRNECESVSKKFESSELGNIFQKACLSETLGVDILQKLGRNHSNSIQLTTVEHGTDYFYICRWVRVK
jgi:16S rRNA (cytosine967-C5)-methyltransferase